MGEANGHLLSHQYWTDEIKKNDKMALVCLSTSSNASSERLNSRASFLFRRSPNISPTLVESILLLKSIRESCRSLFEVKMKDFILDCYAEYKKEDSATKNDCIDIEDISFSDDDLVNKTGEIAIDSDT